MYKLLLCWRYLLTRYLALACIISVMLGVATLIVVNSVMGGFSNKLRERLHGLLSDIIIEARSLDGFDDPAGKMARIRSDPFLRDRIKAMAATMEVFAMLEYRLSNGEVMTRTVRLVGIEPRSRTQIGGFSRHLDFQHDERDEKVPSFQLSPEMRDLYMMRHPLSVPRQPSGELPLFDAAPPPVVPQFTPRMPYADDENQARFTVQVADQAPPPAPPESQVKEPHGIIVGHLLAHYRYTDPQTKKTKDERLLHPGQDVVITTVSGGKLAPVYDSFVVVDYFQSEMSEYDSNYAFVPLDYLQHLRSMDDRVTGIQIRLYNYDRDAEAVVKRLQELDMFPKEANYMVSTWEEKQGPLLAAISIERGILNVLLFLIIGVAGFGILAIFTMIVTEKTRDIGVMKALGASNRGVLLIFVGYGLLLGFLGAALGTALGVTLTNHINEVEELLSRVAGHKVFDRSIYYFDKIPTQIDLLSLVLINVGSVAIAVIFSVLPALRAATLHPVRALRYE